MNERTAEEKLYGENRRLQAEVQMLEDLYPRVTRFEGPLPKSWGDYEKMPEGWKLQLQGENMDHLEYLFARQTLLKAGAEHDKAEARRLQVLKDIPFKDNAAFNALPERERHEWAARLTQAQMLALAGEAPPDPAEAGLLGPTEPLAVQLESHDDQRTATGE